MALLIEIWAERPLAMIYDGLLSSSSSFPLICSILALKNARSYAVEFSPLSTFSLVARLKIVNATVSSPSIFPNNTWHI